MLHGASVRRASVLSFGVAFIVTVLCGAVDARAQAADPGSTGPIQSISANPFTLMFKWFNADYERRITPNVTWDASGSFFSIDDFDYKNTNIALKYYPRASMSGFYLGTRTGLYRVSNEIKGANFYGAGFELGYDWLLGKRDEVVIGIGAGVTRLFGGTLAGASLAVPTVRLVCVGYAF